MFKNYLKISIRNLLRYKIFSTINISGLALGLMCCIIIFKFVISEVGYDTYHEHGDRLYRLTHITEVLSSGERWKNSFSSILWGPALKKDYPEVENYTRVVKSWEPLTFELNGNINKQDNVYYAENSLFELFSWELVAGDAKNVFDHPYSVVLTERTAQKYFDKENPLGKQITLVLQDRDEKGLARESKIQLTVSGIMADVHPKTHVKPEALISFVTLNDFYGGDVNAGTHPDVNFWRWTIGYTYLLLKDGCLPRELERKFPQFLNKYIGDANIARGFKYHLYLQPVAGIHLEKNVYSTPEPGGNKDRLYLFSIISIFVLLIACFNFMNLATARSEKRSLEVGIRKVVGSNRKELIVQFLCESLFMSFIALFLALVLSEFVTPIFSYYTGKELSLLRWENILFIIGLITITLVVGIFAGSYPALFLSAFRPLTMLKKEYQAVKKGVAIRKGLVILQFVITICFIIATLTAKNQISYMKTQELGFNSTHILVLSPAENSPTINEFESFRNDILQNPNVLNISFSNNVPGRMYGQDIWKEYGRKDRNIVPLYEIETDYDFLDVYGLNLIAGRNLSKEMVTDAKVNITNIIAATGGLMPTTKEESGDEKKPEEIAVILNEEAVRRLGLGTPEEALGKILVRDPVALDFTGRVIGVVRDFHFESLQTRIEPLVLYIYDKSAQNSLAASVKISGIDISGTINSIQKLWETHFEETPFAYDFIDENFAKLYEQEEKILEIFGYVSLFIIFIACLGLFGLILYVVEQKTKEIGIRKVLGATVTNILALLSKDFVKLVLIAFLIACPIAYLAMTHWLQNFAYRTNLGIWIFLTAGVLTLVIVLITVCLQALRSALANPVVSLRYE